MTLRAPSRRFRTPRRRPEPLHPPHRTEHDSLTHPTASWGATEILSDEELERVLGELTLRIRRVPHEIWVHGSHAVERPRDIDWTRWAVGPDDSFELAPAVPDRPVVVSPELPFHLLPRAEARVYVRVPLFARLVRRDPSGEGTTLAELPSMILSDTWWGSVTEGELAYWLETRARRAAPAEIFAPHLAVCTLRLVNESSEALPVDRFAIRTAHLTLFEQAGAHWTDEVLVRYYGAAEGSELRYTGKSPSEAGAVVRVAAPREIPPRGLTLKTFGRLRMLSGW